MTQNRGFYYLFYLIAERLRPDGQLVELHRKLHRFHARLKAGRAVHLGHGYPEVAGVVYPRGIDPHEVGALYQRSSLASRRYFEHPLRVGVGQINVAGRVYRGFQAFQRRLG